MEKAQTVTARQKQWRAGYYLVGNLMLASGITLNTVTGLGVSPLISMPFCISEIWSLSFPFMTFLAYSTFVGIQFLLRWKGSRLWDLLQLPFSMVFSLLLSLCGMIFDFSLPHLWQNLLVLLLAIVLTGVGAALMVDMRLIANPADALAQTVGEVTKRGMGFGKNLIDFTAVGITVLIGLLAAGRLVGVGIGTVLSMILIGRVVAIFNHFCKKRITQQAGLA